jgi:hypothetical protein
MKGVYYQKPSRRELMMATSSIFDSIKITDRESAKRLVDAIESSREAKPSRTELRYPVIELDDKGIRELFMEK